jgi:hypothetical protein
MKVKELVGDEIMNAYDGNYLAKDFGYSCANFNVKNSFGGLGGRYDQYFFDSANFSARFGTGAENTPDTFDFYTKNTKNISCFVCYNNEGKIWGRRMFYKGESMINDEDFDVPIKKGEEIKYLYGYYGTHVQMAQNEIFKAVMEKYGEGIIYLDRGVLKNIRMDPTIPKFWIMQVERADFPIFPPVDFLQVCPEIRALANFEPRTYITETLKRDYNVADIKFYGAYRFSPRNKGVKYNYTTWDSHKGVIKSAADLTKPVQEDDEDWTTILDKGDKVKSKTGNLTYKVTMVGDINVMLQAINSKRDFKMSKELLKQYFELAYDNYI